MDTSDIPYGNYWIAGEPSVAKRALWRQLDILYHDVMSTEVEIKQLKEKIDLLESRLPILRNDIEDVKQVLQKLPKKKGTK